MCSVHIPQNFYRQTITRAVTLTTGTNIYVSAHPSPAEGYIAISPASTNLREIVYYTAKGTDGNGTYITVTTANRGLGGTTAQTHAIGEPVRMNVSAETIQEISDALDQIVAGGAQDASTTTKGISKLSVAPASATEPIAVGTNDPRVLSNPAEKKFGGSGVDGALSITSGTTTLDLGGAVTFEKNYTSISITGTGKLEFSNPHSNGTVIFLKSQGNVTLTSSAAPMIDCRLMGSNQGENGKASYFVTGYGGNGVEGLGTTVGGTAMTATYSQLGSTYVPYVKAPIFVGAGSGNGEATGASTTGGTGVKGAGSLIIECGGAWNFTTTGGISVAGSNGGDASGSGTGTAGGGGGGGAGCCIVWYNTLTANTGTVIVSGGTGGAAYNSGSTITADGGGGGGSATAGGGATVGTNASGRSGYTGGTGFVTISKNNDFA